MAPLFAVALSRSRLYRSSYLTIAVGVAAVAGLYLASHYSYLVFHSLAELFSVAIAWSTFTLAWNARRHLDDNYLLFIGIAYLFAGGLDLVHTLAYKGMQIFPGYDSNLPTQLWIAARYLQSLSLLAAAWVVNAERFWRLPASPYLALAGYTVLTTLLLIAIFTRVFPDCYIENTGQTPFKVASEYVISTILVAPLGLLLRRSGQMDSSVLHLLAGSIVVTTFSELAFTSYIGVYDFANLAGHMLKVGAFYLLYLAVIQTGLDKPERLLFQELQKNRNALREAEEKWRLLIENAPVLIITLDREGRILFANQAVPPYTGEQLTGTSFYQLVVEEQQQARQALETVFTQGEIARFESHRTDPSGTESWYQNSLAPLQNAEQVMFALCISGDITERKQAQDTLAFLAECGCTPGKENFFTSLARYLAEKLGMDYVCIDRLEGDLLTAHTVAIYQDGKFNDNVSYRLQDTPCGSVIKQNVCCFPAGVHRLFPRDQVLQEMLAESYVGVTLWSYSGKPIGLIAVIGRRPLAQPRLAQSMLQLVAVRAAGEMERMQAEQTLRQSEAHAHRLADDNAELLREVNHRVGNNLNLLLILIASQIDRKPGPETHAALLDLQSRLYSISKVHQLLQASHWHPVELDQLAQEVVYNALQSLTDDNDIQFFLHTRAPGMCIKAKQSFKLALVFNELVTNSIKYAFQTRPNGRIDITLDREEKGGLPYGLIEFRDNGPGFPNDVLAGEREDIGLHLVRATIVQEMKGKLVLHNEAGAVVNCRFQAL